MKRFLCMLLTLTMLFISIPTGLIAEDVVEEAPAAEAVQTEGAAPAEEEAPAPSAEEDPAPAAEEDPAPAAEEDPAPAAEEDPAPAAEEDPAPAAEEDPAPVDEDDPEQEDEELDLEDDEVATNSDVVIDQQPEDVYAEEGATVSFTVLSANATGFQWKYSMNGGEKWYTVSATSSTLSGGNTNVLSFVLNTTRAGWVFKCVVSNASGSTESDVIRAVISQLPVVNNQPVNTEAEEGGMVYFEVVSLNATSYQWQYSRNNGGSWSNVSATSTTFSGAREAVLSFPLNATRASWLFKCVLTNAAGSTDTNAVKATIIEIDPPVVDDPPVIDSQPVSVEADVGEEVVFTVVSSNTVSYQWQYSMNGGTKWTNVSATSSSLHGGKTATLSFIQSTTRAGWKFKCVLTNEAGSTESAVVNSFLPPPPPQDEKPVIDTQPENVTAAVGEEVVFTVVSSNTDSYQWQYSTNGGTKWTNVSATSSSLHGGKTNALSFTQSATRAKWLFKCVLTNGAGDTESSAVKAVIPVPPVIDTQPENVVAAVGEEVVFTVVSENADSYQWQYSMNGGAKWNNVSATSSSLHGGKTNTLSFAQSATRAKWLFKCILTNDIGSTESDAVRAIIPLPPVIDVQPVDVYVNDGDTVVFNVVSDNADAYQWQYRMTADGKWYNVSPTSSTLSGGKLDTLSFVMNKTRSAWYFQCVLTNEIGSTTSNIVKAYYNILPPEVVTEPESVEAEIGDTITFTVVANTDVSYQWQYSTNNGVKWTNISASSSSLHGAKTDTLSFVLSATRAKWVFKCILSNNLGTAETQVVRATSVPTEFTVDGITYHRIDDANVSVTKVNITAAEILIPATVVNPATGAAMTVSQFDENAFSSTSALIYQQTSANNCKVLKYTGSDSIVEVPSTVSGLNVTAVGADAFLNKSSLVSVSLPNSITVIGARAFKGCTSLSTMTNHD